MDTSNAPSAFWADTGEPVQPSELSAPTCIEGRRVHAEIAIDWKQSRRVRIRVVDRDELQEVTGHPTCCVLCGTRGWMFVVPDGFVPVDDAPVGVVEITDPEARLGMTRYGALRSTLDDDSE